jgi:polyphosphate kinase
MARKVVAEDVDAPGGEENPADQTESRFLNRELSWLEYAARVLACAAEARRPMLERARFLAIFSRNLDEFFQIRVSGLREQLDAGVGGTGPDGMTPRAQLDAIRLRAQELVAAEMQLYEREVKPLLHSGGIRITD